MHWLFTIFVLITAFSSLEANEKTKIVSIAKPVFTADERYINQRYLPTKGGRPRIAIIILNFGLDATTEDILTKLPHHITLAVTPYVAISNELIQRASHAGFMLLAQIPMMSCYIPGHMDQTTINPENFKVWQERLGNECSGFFLESAVHKDVTLVTRLLDFIKGQPLCVWVPEPGSRSGFLQTCENTKSLCGVGDIFIDGTELNKNKTDKLNSSFDLAKKTGSAVITLRLVNAADIESFIEWIQKVQKDADIVSLKQLSIAPKSIPDIYKEDESSKKPKVSRS